jgi:hypothetical protein
MNVGEPLRVVEVELLEEPFAQEEEEEEEEEQQQQQQQQQQQVEEPATAEPVPA